MITKEQLKKIMPGLKDDKLELYFPYLTEAMQWYGITTPLRIAAFLAQLGHESMDLKYMQEIASGEAYEGRKDLGNVNPGDGKRYKGRGPIQLTGRANYEQYGKLLNIDLINNPEQAALPKVAFKIAGIFWTLKKLNALADQGDMREITIRINGGTNGLDDRMSRYATALSVFANE